MAAQKKSDERQMVNEPHWREITSDLDGSLDGAIAYLQRLKEEIEVPEGAHIHLSYEDLAGPWDHSRNGYRVHIRRPETDEEMQARINSRETWEAEQVAARKALYEQMRKEFGDA